MVLMVVNAVFSLILFCEREMRNFSIISCNCGVILVKHGKGKRTSDILNLKQEKIFSSTRLPSFSSC